MDFGSIQQVFADRAAQTPDAIAVIVGDLRLSYRDLDGQANQLAHRLISEGAGPEKPVAVLMERSAGLIVATLAVLKAGSYYVPVHTAYPAARVQGILDQLGGPLLLVDRATHARGGLPRGCTVILVDEHAASERPSWDPAIETTPEHLAYVMFTSGSTGEPKGVAVTHQNVLDLALDPRWDGGAHERVLMVAPYAFGMSTYELWEPLLRGGRIIAAPPGDLEVATLHRLIVDEEVTVVHLTAGLFRVVAEENPSVLATLREVMTGGDVISPTAIAKVFEACPEIVIRAMYGQTETTLFATNSPMTAPYRAGTSVAIGGPMQGMRVYILDEELRPVGDGVIGELYVAGAGVARGYLGRPDLTAERFVPDLFGGPGERMFRTGDLARWTSEGLVDFLGRADDQIKIRGFRVELGEVEAALASYPGLTHVVVVAVEAEPGDKRLAAYVVPKAGEVDVSALRSHATDLLPDYAVPASFSVLDELPLTANGKLDRRRLPAPTFEQVAEYRQPRTPTEEALCSIFADVLNVPAPGIHDSFFDLSGQSMQAIRLIMRVEQDLGIRPDISDLYSHPTPAQLAQRLETLTAENVSGAR
ncbi:MAG: non-ribosomal peptide synthetase [Jatrophihabitantaceae bacterium]